MKKILIRNPTRRSVWLTLRYDAYKNIVHIALFPRQPPMAPRIEQYERLRCGHHVTLKSPEWSETTEVVINDASLGPSPNYRFTEEKNSEDSVHVYTLRITADAN